MLQDRNFYIGLVAGAVLAYWWAGRQAKPAEHRA